MVAWYIPAGISAGASILGGIVGSNQQKAYAESQREWGQYNATMQFNTAVGNVSAQTAIAGMNAQLGLTAAKMSSSAMSATANYNAGAIRATAAYNASLLGVELTNLWDAMELDLLQLEQERERERGTLIANQAASGTVIDEGSNRDVVVSQRTQENLDAFVIRHQADVEASRIQNAIAQSLWQGEVQARQVQWEGQVNSTLNLANAKLAAIGGMGEAFIGGNAQLRSARSGLLSGMAQTEFNYTAQNQQAANTFTSGLFQGLGQFTQSYYKNKVPVVPSTPTTSLVATGGSGGTAPASSMLLTDMRN